MEAVRQPAVAGSFYPADPGELRAQVQGFLQMGRAGSGGAPPKAIIAPHAGYVFSGPVAGSAYARLALGRGTIERVVLLGPSHRVPFRGLAVSGARAFATPLGEVPVDAAAVAAIRDLPQVQVWDAPHLHEHSLEVQLPFLQEALGAFLLVPVVVGDALGPEVDAVLERLWGGPETAVVVSSDLSHFLDHTEACIADRATTASILTLRPEEIGSRDACGCCPVRGLLEAARTHGLAAELLDLRTSADTAGDPSRVVGYGAYAFA